jgi:hypothetical protein
MKLLFALLVVLSAASPAPAERNTLCDDGGPLDVTCSVSLPTLGDFTCGSSGLVALKAGCYLCVDAMTCTALGSLTLNAEEQGDSLPLPKASGKDISVLLQDQADQADQEAAFGQAAAVANGDLAVASPARQGIADPAAKPPEVSNWLFSIPVCLAVVSLCLAIRARMPSRSGFQRLQDRRDRPSALFQDNINPFCDADDEDFTVETAGRFQGDPSNSEDARFLPSSELEDDEFSKAEAEAIKQAVLLHIRAFDEQEDEEVAI